MKPTPKNLHLLLDALLPPAAGHCGPSCTEVLDLLRQQARRRRQLRSGAAVLAVMACLFAAIRWHNAPLPPIAQAPARPAPLVIRQVNDAQLFALLKDTPAALLKLPDGTSRLLVLDP